MKRKILAALLCLILTTSYFLPVSAAEIIINGGFNDGALSFTGVSFYDDPTADGGRCVTLTNPCYRDAVYGFSALYLYPIHLKEGHLYNFSMRVRSVGKEIAAAYSTVNYDTLSNEVVFYVHNASDDWQTVTGVFIAGSDRDLDIVIHLAAADSGVSALIDNVSLTEQSAVPVSLQIEGPTNVLVPERGYSSYRYNAVAIDKSGGIIPIIRCGLTFSELPYGVTYSEDLKTLYVSNDAEVGATFTLTATPPDFASSLSPVTLKITTGKNYIENGDFDDLPSLNGFFSESGTLVLSDDALYGKNAYIEPREVSENNYLATVNIDNTYLLDASKIYVFRAMVRSESDYYSRKTDTSNGITGPDGSININVSNVGNRWTQITSVIEVSNEGIYRLNINFLSSDERPVYLDCVGLYAEELCPTNVIFSAPAHICIPQKEALRVPFNYTVRDQRSNIITGEEVVVSVSPSDNGVSTDAAVISVSPEAKSGIYELTARSVNYPDCTGSFSIEVSDEAIGDGSFELQAPGQWFSTAAPSMFNISSQYNDYLPPNGEKFGRLTMNGNVSALMCDSVVSLRADTAYVFSSYIRPVVRDIATTVTVMIYNSWAQSFEDNLAVLQFDVGDEEFFDRVFVPERDITGRLMVAFTTPQEHDAQIVLLDNILIRHASVGASRATISGYPYPDRVLSGNYRFTSNFETADMSTCRWLISPTKDGVYMPIAGETENTISVTGEMVGSFLKFEVTPASLNGPVSGAAAVSSPVEIVRLPSGSGTPTYVNTPPDTDEDEITPSQIPNTNLVNRGTTFNVINIYADSFTKSARFFDIDTHWAREDITLMNAAGIVNGRSSNLFEPSVLITRAEFSAFLIRSFSLAPLYYEGGFDDVNSWDWYSGVVETVTKYSMAQGIGNKLFAPDVPITREQITLMSVKALEMTGAKIGGISDFDFSDADKISPWAEEAVKKAVTAGIITGYADNSLRPQDNTTRAEAVSILKRMLTYVINYIP